MASTFVDFLKEAGIHSFRVGAPDGLTDRFKLNAKGVAEVGLIHGGKPLIDSYTHDGHYEMSAKDFAHVEKLGQAVIDKAKEMNVDLKQFPEIKAAMGYDKNQGELSAAELGSFMAGLAMQNSTFRDTMFFGLMYDPSNIVRSTLKPDNPVPAQTKDLAVNLGQQVYGDNRPDDSSIRTQGEVKWQGWGDPGKPKL